MPSAHPGSMSIELRWGWAGTGPRSEYAPGWRRQVVTWSLPGPGISSVDSHHSSNCETTGWQAGLNSPHVKPGQSQGEDYETMDVRG